MRHLASVVSSFRPTPDQERWQLLAVRYPALQRHAPVVSGKGDWRSVGLLTRCVFFFLGLIVVAATGGILAFISRSEFALVTGLILWAVGEGLIRTHRLNRAGFEEALISAGMVLAAIGVMQSWRSPASELWALAMSLAMLAAGFRLLNPLLTTVAAVVMSTAIALNSGWQLISFGSGSTLHAGLRASLYCYVLSGLALGFGQRHFKRPSHDRILDSLVVVMPVVGYLWAAFTHSFRAVNYWQQHTLSDLFVLLAPLLLGISALAVGWRRRTHAPLLAFMLCLACVGYELRGLTSLPLQLKLLLWGVLVLTVVAIIDRSFRRSYRGVTSQRVSEQSGLLDMAELAGAAIIAPANRTAANPTAIAPGGGGFGGGGASGQF